jgi:hypothetical protein
MHYNKVSLVVFFSVALFLPTFHSFIGSNGVAIVNGALILILSFNILYKLISGSLHYDKKYLAFVIIPIGLNVLLFPMSMLQGAMLNEVEIVDRDIFDFHKPILYFLILTSLYPIMKNSTEFINRIFLLLFFILFTFAILQYLKLSSDFFSLYTKKSNLASQRVSAPFINPYDFAFIISFFCIHFLLSFLRKSKAYVIPLVLAFLIIILPQSRSIIFSFLVGGILIIPTILFYVWFDYNTFRIKRTYINLIIIMTIFSAVLISLIDIIATNFPYLTNQITRFITSGSIGTSAEIRYQQFLFFLDYNGSSIPALVFGNGPSKNVMEYVESVYVYLGFRYGILGLSIYFFILFATAFKALTIYKKTLSNGNENILLLSIGVWMLFIPLMSVGNNFTDQVRLSFFFYFLVVYTWSMQYPKRNW